jgi:hypothetical protein
VLHGTAFLHGHELLHRDRTRPADLLELLEGETDGDGVLVDLLGIGEEFPHAAGCSPRCPVRTHVYRRVAE